MLAVALFTIAMGFMGCFYCGMKVNGLDICPNYAGTVMAIVNGLGATSGIITPYIVSALTEDVSCFIYFTKIWVRINMSQYFRKDDFLFGKQIQFVVFIFIAHSEGMEISFLDILGHVNFNGHSICHLR